MNVTDPHVRLKVFYGIDGTSLADVSRKFKSLATRTGTSQVRRWPLIASRRLSAILFCEMGSFLGRLRHKLAEVIRGDGRLPQDLSGEQRRAMWPPAADLADKHLTNCRVIRDREALLEFLPKQGVCAEVGILHSEFSAKIIAATTPTKLHLIEIEPRRASLARAKFGEEITAARVQVHCGDSAAMLDTMPDGYFDWVYIDGDHSYEGCRRDLEASRRKIKNDGLIVLNDYTFFGPSDFVKYGVMESVHELCVNYGFEMVYLALQGRGYHDVALRRIVET